MAASTNAANVICSQVRLLKQGKPLDVQARTMLWNVYCYFQLHAQRSKSTSMIGDAIEKTSLATGISVFTVRGIVLKGRQQLKDRKPLDFTFAPRKKRAIKEGPKIPRALYRTWKQAKEAAATGYGLTDEDEDEEEEVDDEVEGETLEDTVTAEINTNGGSRLEAVQQLTIASDEHMSLDSWKKLQRTLRVDPFTERTEQGFFGSGRSQFTTSGNGLECGSINQERTPTGSQSHHNHQQQSEQSCSSHWGHFVLNRDY